MSNRTSRVEFQTRLNHSNPKIEREFFPAREIYQEKSMHIHTSIGLLNEAFPNMEEATYFVQCFVMCSTAQIPLILPRLINFKCNFA